MAKELTEKIEKLRDDLVGSGISKDITSADLESVEKLMQEATSDIESLKKIDKEIYGDLIVRLTHQRTEDSKELLVKVFADAADLHISLGNLMPVENISSTDYSAGNLLHKKLKYCTDSATFLNYVLLNSSKSQEVQDAVFAKLNDIYEYMNNFYLLQVIMIRIRKALQSRLF